MAIGGAAAASENGHHASRRHEDRDALGERGTRQSRAAGDSEIVRVVVARAGHCASNPIAFVRALVRVETRQSVTFHGCSVGRTSWASMDRNDADGVALTRQGRSGWSDQTRTATISSDREPGDLMQMTSARMGRRVGAELPPPFHDRPRRLGELPVDGDPDRCLATRPDEIVPPRQALKTAFARKRPCANSNCEQRFGWRLRAPQAHASPGAEGLPSSRFVSVSSRGSDHPASFSGDLRERARSRKSTRQRDLAHNFPPRRLDKESVTRTKHDRGRNGCDGSRASCARPDTDRGTSNVRSEPAPVRARLREHDFDATNRRPVPISPLRLLR